MSAVTATHSGTGSLSLMSCVRESSPPQDFGADFETEKNVGAAKRKFWNPRKWFKRKNKTHDDAYSGTNAETHESAKDSIRSRSTSELSIVDDHNRRSGTPMYPGLSVSHDSVFHSPHSGSELELETAQSSSLSIIHPAPDFRLQTELSERLRLRRGRGDTSEDDEGLPHSPCNSPTTTEGLLDKPHRSKEHPTKSHSTSSNGSLLSMGSSDMDDDSYSQQSRHSSRFSLHESRKTAPQPAIVPPDTTDADWELGGPPTHLTTLNHSAAHHKSAVRPKRTHGAPRRRRGQQISTTVLPSTPEVNEDILARGSTPDNTSKEPLTELIGHQHKSETQLKCSSLPPGLAAPTAKQLSRSTSNAATSKSQEHFGALQEEDEREEKSDRSFFERLFPRRSAKKKRNKEIVIKTTSSTASYGAARRQRVQPMEIPASPEMTPKVTKDVNPEVVPTTPEKLSPLQVELEARFSKQQKQEGSQFVETLPPKPIPASRETRLEELKSKVKIAGLSALQQRVLLHNDESDGGGCKSLTNLPTDMLRVSKPVIKSHSFKAVKDSGKEEIRFTYAASEEVKVDESGLENKRMSIVKAASLESVKSEESTGKFVVKKEIVLAKVENKEEKHVPEFLQRQLNKVEARASSNVILKTSAKVSEVDIRPKSVVNCIPEPTHEEETNKDINIEEIPDKDNEEVIVEIPKQTLSSPSQRIYKKHETAPNTQRKSSLSTEKPMLKTKSSSLEIVGSIKKETLPTSQSSQDTTDPSSDSNTVILRRKSLPKQRTDDEPELMKVFARRSLKLKDGESEEVSEAVKEMAKSRDSDKENLLDSPGEERKQEAKPQIEAKKPTVNNRFGYQRAVSVNSAKIGGEVKKQGNLVERPKTDNWFLMRKQEVEKEEKVEKTELISSIATKNDFINEDFAIKSKNFNQKKAEWEKRAQEALKKKIP